MEYYIVTLYVRVWIETDCDRLEPSSMVSHPLREGVD